MNSQPDPDSNLSPNSAELVELCDRLLDQELSTAERARLEELVLSQPEARQFYVEYLHLHAALRQNATGLDELPLSERFRTDSAATIPIGTNRWSVLKLAAALVVGALVAAGINRLGSSKEPALAQLVEAEGARWESSSLPTEPGSSLGKGRLRLAQGLARLIFRSGAEVSFEGPGELELINANACFLHAGSLVAHVPVPARGFSVATAHAELIDHGTDFGMSTDPSGRAQVQVLEGEVELKHDRSGETLHLHTQQSASVTPEKFTAGLAAGTEVDRYAFNRSAQQPLASALSLTTAMGKGEAAYAVAPGSALHNSDTLLLLKNAPTKNYLRKAFLRFDLSSLGARRVESATLTLNFEPSGFGYASLGSESTFAVYGVTDDAQDSWNAANLNWENAPAYAPEGGTVDTKVAVKLGTFTLAKGVLSGAFSISGAALGAFLNQDVNRLATMVVVRETSEATVNAPVHGFAGNRHPTLAAPTLRLTLSAP